MSDDVLRVRQLSMTFPGTRALDGVTLSVGAGEVHALAGHNGSGKSTFIKILAGQYAPDTDSAIEVDGQPLAFLSPKDSAHLGLRFVHQDLALVDSLSITENVALGSGYTVRGLGRIRWSRQHERVHEEMAKLGHDLDPRTAVGSLPAATRSAVGIARALMTWPGQPKARLILLDEVTATMPELEAQRLLELVGRLKQQGIGIIYVSHHLDEMLAVADRISVLREGRLITTVAGSSLTQETLADHVVGSAQWRDRDVRPPAELPLVPVEASTAELRVDHLSGPTVRDLSFSASPGRIIGIAGITGSGRDEVAELVLGDHGRGGSVRVGGEDLPAGRLHDAVARGVMLVPASRINDAVIPVQTIRENITISGLGATRLLAPIDRRSERREVDRWISDLTIRGAAVDGDITKLSGGNQQKAILARCLRVEPKVLLLDEPTQGVDIGAAAQIHLIIKEVSTSSSVVVCSSDNYELAELCSEVIVLRRGRVVGHLHGDEITEEALDRLELSGPTSGPDDTIPPNPHRDRQGDR